MKKLERVTIVLILSLLCGCRSADRDPVTTRLNWSVSATNVYTYTLDGKEVGDYAALKKRIADLPRRSRILVEPYHESGRYHFERLGLRELCREHEVQLVKPLAE